MKTLKTLSVTAILIIFTINIHCKCCEGYRTRTWNDNIDEEHKKIKSKKYKKSKKSKKDEKDKKLKNNKTDKTEIHINDKKTGNLSIIKEENKQEEDDKIEGFTIKIKKVTVTAKVNEMDEYNCNVKDIEESLNGLCEIKYKNKYYSKSIYNDLMKILIDDNNKDILNEVYLYDYSKDKKIKLTVRTQTRKDVNIETTSNAPIRLIKELFSQKEGVQISQQRLIFAAKQLDDDKTIEEYNIKQDATLNMVYRIPRNAQLFQNNE